MAAPVTSIRLDDLVPPGQGAVLDDSGSSGFADTANYQIPPVVWMIVFLIVGYVGVRLALEAD